jgi:hypothetical protein
MFTQNTLPSRHGMRTIAGVALMASVAGLASSLIPGGGTGGAALAQTTTDPNNANDFAQLNLALNIAYLKATYYAEGLDGTDLRPLGIGGTALGPAGAVTVKDSPLVPIVSPQVRQAMDTFLDDELAQIVFLRGLMGGAAAPPPAIDLMNSFNTLSQASGTGVTFDPFADEDSFLVGATFLEDLSVTSYHNTVPSLTATGRQQAAAGMLGTEAYHAGAMRMVLLERGVTGTLDSLEKTSSTIALRTPIDLSLTEDSTARIAPTNASGLVFTRAINQTLRILYLNSSGAPGGFLPSGATGSIH